MVRSTIFNLCYFAILLSSIVICLPVLIFKEDKAAIKLIQQLAKLNVWLFKKIMNVTIEIRGQKYMPEEGPVLLAAKHHSEMDPIFMISILDNVAALTLKLKIPLANWYLSRIGMIMIEASKNKTERTIIEVENAIIENKVVLIYPEGELTEVGENSRFRMGVWHFYNKLKMPVTPVATNLGLRWSKKKWLKHPGPAVVEFLPEIKLGLSKEDFFEKLKKAVHEGSDKLIVEQRDEL